MKEVLFFYIPTCSHSAQAIADIEEIKKEYPQYANIVIRKVDETLNPAFADKFDYNYVPCMYVDGIKYIEGDCDKEKILAMFKEIAG